MLPGLQVETLAKTVLHDPVEVQVGGRSVVNKDIHQSVELRPEGERFLRLLEILGQWVEQGKVLIFVQTQEQCDNLFRDLLKVRCSDPITMWVSGTEQALQKAMSEAKVVLSEPVVLWRPAAFQAAANWLAFKLRGACSLWSSALLCFGQARRSSAATDGKLLQVQSVFRCRRLCTKGLMSATAVAAVRCM